MVDTTTILIVLIIYLIIASAIMWDVCDENLEDFFPRWAHYIALPLIIMVAIIILVCTIIDIAIKTITRRKRDG